MSTSQDARMAGWSRNVALAAGALLVALGVWAMAAPRSFFTTLATFEPYNQHFLQDIGAFQIGLGAVLLLAVRSDADALAVALGGVGIGGLAHLVSHLIGLDLGGAPVRDIPFFSFLTVLLLWAGWSRSRAARQPAPRT